MCSKLYMVELMFQLLCSYLTNNLINKSPSAKTNIQYVRCNPNCTCICDWVAVHENYIGAYQYSWCAYLYSRCNDIYITYSSSHISKFLSNFILHITMDTLKPSQINSLINSDVLIKHNTMLLFSLSLSINCSISFVFPFTTQLVTGKSFHSREICLFLRHPRLSSLQ